MSHAFFIATTYLCNAGAGPDYLNNSLSVYIPKKGLGVGPHGIQAKAGEARPLALKNASAKILWRTLARAVSPALQSWAHFSQRGFVAGRIPGHGVVDIDTSGRVVSLLHSLGVLSLYDLHLPSRRSLVRLYYTSCVFPDFLNGPLISRRRLGREPR